MNLISSKKNQQQKNINSVGIKLAKRIQFLIYTIFIFSLIYILFIISQSTNIFHEWQEQKNEALVVAIDKIIQKKQMNVKFSSLAIVPLKDNFTELIEEDKYNAIYVLLEDIKENYDLDVVELLH